MPIQANVTRAQMAEKIRGRIARFRAILDESNPGARSLRNGVSLVTTWTRHLMDTYPSVDDAGIIGYERTLLGIVNRRPYAGQSDECREVAARYFDFLDAHITS